MIYDAVIVGGGASGLTAAAYLAKYGRRVLLCEKEAVCGGLVNSFERNGFVFDSGIRALEDAGVLFTMLRQLGLEMEFVKNRVSIGIEDRVMEVESDQSLGEYGDLLSDFTRNQRTRSTAIIERSAPDHRVNGYPVRHRQPAVLGPQERPRILHEKGLPLDVQIRADRTQGHSQEQAGHSLSAGFHLEPVLTGYHHAAFFH